jgi:hypothetical protein
MLICLITDPLACAISFGSCVVAIFFNLKEFYLFFLTKFKCLKKSDRKSKGIFKYQPKNISYDLADLDTYSPDIQYDEDNKALAGEINEDNASYLIYKFEGRQTKGNH